MHLVHETLTVGETSNEWSVNKSGKMGVDIRGTFGGEVYTMQSKPGEGAESSFTAYAPDGNTVTFAAAGVHSFEAFGSQRFRLVGDSGGSGTDVDVFVGGDWVDID